ncbi:MAG TPA: RidA family protein, partial [Actinophytocola sp.]|nr:RidA family protein [Actinophytocola sp.]
MNAAGADGPRARLASLGLELPSVAAPKGVYLPARRTGNQVWTSGQLPLVGGELPATGLVGAEVTVDDAAAYARIATLNALAAIDALVGLEAIASVVKVVGYVASAPGFGGQPQVINGASELLGAVFGSSGEHARSAIGVAALPLGAPVEVEVVV